MQADNRAIAHGIVLAVHIEFRPPAQQGMGVRKNRYR